MKEADFIKFKSADIALFYEMVAQQFRDAIVSFPFCENRKSEENIHSQLAQHLKIKFVTGLFFHFLQTRIHENQIAFTPQADSANPGMTDFSIKNTAFRIIPNFIELSKAGSSFRLHQLPALIPNIPDQNLWQGRKHTSQNRNDFKFLFTFMEDRFLHGLLPLVELKIAPPAIQYLCSIRKIFRNQPDEAIRLDRDEIWAQFTQLTAIPNLRFGEIPVLFIAGMAGKKEFDFFSDTDDKHASGYAHYTGRYYETDPAGGLRFLGGVIHTNIKNATCPTEALPAFKDFLNSV